MFCCFICGYCLYIACRLRLLGVAMWVFVLFAVTFLFSLLGVWLLDLLLFAAWFEYTLLVVVLDGSGINCLDWICAFAVNLGFWNSVIW